MPAPIADEIINSLQRSVSLHLTAVEHYATIAEHLGRWGYNKLRERFAADASEEREHLRGLLARLEFFDAAPVMTHVAPSWPRTDVAGILDRSLMLETTAAAVERAAITTARSFGDELTAQLFASNLAGSEDSIREIEADKLVITQVGLDNWLANQT